MNSTLSQDPHYPEHFHLIPFNDLKVHVEAGGYCHCKPRIQQEGLEGNDRLIIHNAYDGRELWEGIHNEGTRAISN